MLDIGVGGGRTTCNFANLAEEYVGIDYSENMIAACRKRFPHPSRNISFKVCDAVSMKMFKTSYFDFILFSYNGIDYISHEERLKALQEIQRVGKPGGFFCFSAHNLRGIKSLQIRLSISPVRILKEILRVLLLRFWYNRSVIFRKLKNENYAIINDGEYNFRSSTYYIKPEEQIRQLSQGFKNIRVFSSEHGKEVNMSETDSITECWLYYLCNLK